jgi:hypothetical protein
MLIGFRQPKQMINYVPNAQYVPSAPNLANTMLGAALFSRPMMCPQSQKY